MKISLFTSWNSECGIADYSFSFKKVLEEAGVTVGVTLVPKRKKSSDFVRLCSRINAADIAHIQHEFSFFGKNLIQPAWLLFVLMAKINIPIVITLHELPLSFQGRCGWVDKFLFGSIYGWVLLKAKLILIHTEKHREILLGMGIQQSRIAHFSHPIPEIERSSDDPFKCKEALGVKGKKVFTIFGFVSARKGYDLAIEAVRGLDDCVLLIAGGKRQGDVSDYFFALERKIKDLKLEGKVIITGYVPEKDIAKVMGATDVVLAPFREMGGSGSLSLSIAFHKPIVASDIGPMRELLEQGVGLEMFRNGDSMDLKDKMKALSGNVIREMELVEMNRRYAQEHSFTRSAVTMIEHYRKVLAVYSKTPARSQ